MFVKKVPNKHYFLLSIDDDIYHQTNYTFSGAILVQLPNKTVVFRSFRILLPAFRLHKIRNGTTQFGENIPRTLITGTEPQVSITTALISSVRLERALGPGGNGLALLPGWTTFFYLFKTFSFFENFMHECNADEKVLL